MKFNIGRNK